jgi:galactokinase
VEFSSYNKQAGKGLASPVTVDGPIRAAKDAFKRDVIHRHIAEEELSTGSMMSWMQSVRQRMRYDAEKIRLDHQRFVSSSVGIEEERRRVIAAQFPVTRDRGEFLGSGDRAGDEATCARLDELLAKFRDLTSLAPKCIVRAPGRVNLIGEHCDYNSFPVIGVATRQGTLLVGAQSLDPRVSVMHVDAANFGAGSFGTNGRGVVWEGEQADWCSYVSWGWTAMMENIGAGGRKAGRGCGARVLVSGDLPRAAGLGSSSSLVTASAMMAARLNRVRLGREELALVAAEGERVGAGTRGGAVDHTVSMCGVKAAAVLVSFSPKLEAVTMPLPRSASFVVVNSGVHAFKGQHDGTKALFNTRVIECRVGAAIVARRLRTHLSVTVSTPGQLFNMERAGGRAASVGRLIERVSTVLGPTEALTLDEAVAELGLERESAEWKERFLLGIEVDPGVRLEVGRRMAHVLSEAERVERFRAVLESFAGEDSGGDEGGVIGELGALLSASHVSLRDNYACSIREVDALVEFCVGQGSVGSRITGAGWGGCVLSLVPDQFLSSFLSSLRGRLGHAAVFVAEPSAGASVLAM